MLKKIVLLNSANYEKAVLTLDANSIQIVGKNNIGKTTLIGVLNFLYIPDQRDWNFSQSPTETLEHYFPKLDKTYIIFEIFKNYSFCVLLRKEAKKAIGYYRIDLPYDEAKEHIFEHKDGKEVLLDFESIQTNLIGKIYRLERAEYNELLYGRSKRDKSVLWLAKDIKLQTFSKIYKNLLNPQLITNDSFKESLLVADDKADKSIEFTLAGNQKIEDMQKLIRNISQLESVKERYLKFKTSVEEYNVRVHQIQNLLGSFDKKYKEEMVSLKADELSFTTQMLKYDQELIPPLEKEKNGLLMQKGRLEAEKKSVDKEIDIYQDTLNKINNLDPLNMLLNGKDNTKKQLEVVVYKLSQIKNESYTLENIEKRIQSVRVEINKHEGQIQNFQNLLRHHISDDISVRERMNAILSDQVLNLDKSFILKKISSDYTTLQIYNGEIDVSSLESRSMVQLEELEEKLLHLRKEIKKYEDIKTNLLNQKQLVQEKESIESALKILEEQITLAQSKPSIEIEVQKRRETKETLQKQWRELEEKYTQIESKISEYKGKKDQIRKQLSVTEEKIRGLNSQSNLLREMRDKYGTLDTQENVNETAENIFNKINDENTLVRKLESNNNSEFNYLKNILQKEHGEEDAFIKEVDEDIDTMSEKRKSIDSLIESITNETSKPTQSLLTEFEHFSKYVDSLNSKYKKYQISDIKSVEIRLSKNEGALRELKKIANISKNDLFSLQNSEERMNAMEILKNYIARTKKIHISELFELSFVVDGKERDLKKQIESNGTDIMLKTSLLMLIIGNIIIPDENNKLVIYLDELSAVDDDNVRGFIDRCIENHFLPILASPDKKVHIEKYYDIIKSRQTGRIVVDDRRAIYAKDRI